MEFDASKVFQRNVSTFVDTFRFVDGAIDRYDEEEMPRLREASQSRVPSDGSKVHLDKLREFAAHLGRHFAVKQVVDWQNGWYIVMMVTITEAYLRDALVEAAGYDSSLMERSEQTLTYPDVCDAESIESLARRMRDTWAKGFVESGGPKRWIEKLKRWGAKGLTGDMESDLERMWGIRHVMVHRAGKVDDDFLKRHSEFEADNTGNVIVSGDDVGGLTVVAIDFVKCVNRYLEDRCKANAKSAT